MAAPRSKALDRLLGAVRDFTARGSMYDAHCPGPLHRRGDTRKSLGISLGDNGSVILRCLTGCPTTDVLAALGLDYGALYDTTARGGRLRRWHYVTPEQREYVHWREDLPDGSRHLWWTNGSGKRTLGGTGVETLPLYGHAKLEQAAQGSTVYLCEGEPDADALSGQNLLAAGTATGAATIPCDASLRALLGFRVLLWPDADVDPAKGLRHMRRIAERLALLKEGE